MGLHCEEGVERFRRINSQGLLEAVSQHNDGGQIIGDAQGLKARRPPVVRRRDARSPAASEPGTTVTDRRNWSATADKIKGSLDVLWTRVKKSSCPIPPPDTIEGEYNRVLSAAYRRLQSRTISARFVNQMQSLRRVARSCSSRPSPLGDWFAACWTLTKLSLTSLNRM